MCGSCWVKMGQPVIWNQDIADAAGLIAKLHEIDEAYGPLHVALDDWNLEDDRNITPMYAIPAYGHCPGYPDDYSKEVHELCDRIAEMLTAMPLGWRGSTLAHAEKWAIEGRVAEYPQAGMS